jgi:hypothetical protein
MSRRALGIAVVVIATLLSSAAIGRSGLGGTPVGHVFGLLNFVGAPGVKFVRSHSVRRGIVLRQRLYARRAGTNFSKVRDAAMRSGSPGKALNSLSRSGTLRGQNLANPTLRAQITAAVALAGWHGGAAANGWWQHAGGGYGWVGPLFWPYAYHDIYDYAIRGDRLNFWDYGYGDIYAGIFAPYGYNDLTGYLSQGRSARPLRGFVQLCGDDSRAIVGLPIDLMAGAVRPTKAQGGALDELGSASMAAARNIRAACPTEVALTAPSRLAAMEQRLEAMVAAAATIKPALEKFYGSLDDAQEARLNALAEEQQKMSAANNAQGSNAQRSFAQGSIAQESLDQESLAQGSLAQEALAQGLLGQSCGVARPLEWPASEIEDKLHPNDIQRGALKVLQDTNTEIAEMLKSACPMTDEAMTPPVRLAAVADRLDAMLRAVKLVRAALEDFYATLDDEQKAQFEAIGPRRST